MLREVEGFNIHAAVRIAGNDREGLETLCRHVCDLCGDRMHVLADVMDAAAAVAILEHLGMEPRPPPITPPRAPLEEPDAPALPPYGDGIDPPAPL